MSAKTCAFVKATFLLRGVCVCVNSLEAALKCLFRLSGRFFVCGSLSMCVCWCVCLSMCVRVRIFFIKSYVDVEPEWHGGMKNTFNIRHVHIFM